MKYFSVLAAIALCLCSPFLISKPNLRIKDLKIGAPMIHDIKGDDSFLSSITLTNLGEKPLKAVHLKLMAQNPYIKIPDDSLFVPQLAQGETYKHSFKLKLSDKHHFPIENCNKSGITLTFKESHRQSQALGDVIKRAQGALEVWLSPKKGLCAKIQPRLGLNSDMDLFEHAERGLKSISYRSQYNKLSDYWQLIALFLFLAAGIYRYRKF